MYSIGQSNGPKGAVGDWDQKALVTQGRAYYWHNKCVKAYASAIRVQRLFTTAQLSSNEVDWCLYSRDNA